MRPRPPVTLWVRLGGDLLRILAIATVALVGVIAFAGAMRPLADGQVSAADALKLVALLSVPMLQFALPFAAGFAATLSYHRFAADNEATAAHAGAIGHLALLAPAGLIGLALSVLLAGLTNFAIPGFLRRAELLVQSDVAMVLVAPIERGRSIAIGDLSIHADRAVGPLRPDPSTGATDHVALYGVLAVRDDGRGEPTFYNAERVDLWVFAPGEDGAATVQLRFTGARTSSDEGALRQDSFSTKRLRIPRSFRDDPKFMTLPELLDLPNRPRAIEAIDVRAARLAAALDRRRLIDAIGSRLAGEGRITLRREGLVVSVNAGSLEPAGGEGVFTLRSRVDGAPMTVTLESPGSAPRSVWAEGVTLTRPPAQAPGAAATLTLGLSEVTTPDPDDPEVRLRQAERAITGLSLADPPASVDGAPLDELTAMAREALGRGPADDGIERTLAALERDHARLLREVTSKLHERLCYAASLVVMVLAGAVIALRMRDAMPLPVYLWSFLPALGAIVTISSGERMAYRYGEAGLVVLWGGVVGLALYTLIAFLSLRRH